MSGLKPIEKLAERLKRDHNIEIDLSTFSRTRPGYWQRAAGAWSWFAYLVERGGGKREVGSQYGVVQLLKCAKWEVGPNHYGQLEIDPATAATVPNTP